MPNAAALLYSRTHPASSNVLISALDIPLLSPSLPAHPSSSPPHLLCPLPHRLMWLMKRRLMYAVKKKKMAQQCAMAKLRTCHVSL